MTSYICFLRGINVGGKTLISMSDIKQALHERFPDCKTYIQTGNIMFSSSKQSIPRLEAEIEQLLQNKCSKNITAIVRTTDQIKATIKNNPFKKKDTKFLYVTFFKSNIELKKQDIQLGPLEEIEIQTLQLYFYCPNGYGKTKLSNNFFEKITTTKATTRNWNTIQKINDMLSESIKK